ELRFCGEVALQAEEVCAVMHRGDFGIEVERHDRRAARQQRLDAGLADAGCRTGDQRHLAAEWQRCATLAQLGLLQVPVFDIKEVPGRQRLEAAESGRALDDVYRVVVDIGDDSRILGTPADGT